jgi:DNA-binding beta-propeller fold protein YncE
LLGLALLAAGLQAEHVAGDPLAEEKAGLKVAPGALEEPFGLAFDGAGTLTIVELGGGRVLRREKSGALAVLAGRRGTKGYAGDGGPAAEALLNGPHNLAATAAGDLFIADTWNHAVRRIDGRAGTIATVAGTGKSGFGGDGGPARDAQFHDVMCVTLSPDAGTLFITDLANRRVRAMELKAGTVRTVAGNGAKGVPPDGARAVEAPLVDPRAAAPDAKGNLYILERGGNALRRVAPDGTIKTVVAPEAGLRGPKHLCVDPAGNVYIADEVNALVRKFDPKSGELSTVLGGGAGGRHLSRPHGVAWRDGTLWVADTGHHRVLRLPMEAKSSRSPVDVALTPDGRWALTANRASDTVSLVDLAEGRVAAELPAGRAPFVAALSRDGGRAVVTGLRSDSIALLRVAPPALEAEATVAVGREPRGAVLSPDGRTAFVALAGEGAVVAVDLQKRAVSARAAVGQEPWHVALTPDGGRLLVACVLSRELWVLEAATLKPLFQTAIRGANARRVAVSPDGAWAYLPYLNDGRLPTTTGNISLGWIVSNRVARIALGEPAPREAVNLDPRGRAVGDLDGLAVSPDGQALAVAAAGTHELLLLRLPLPFDAWGSSDLMDGRLARDGRRFRRVPLGGRPMAAAFTPDGARVVAADALGDALRVVDVERAEAVGTIALGGPAEPSAARRGEAIFTDATRSHEQWYSCNTCHVEGHTNGTLFDTTNDGSTGTLKKTPSLRGVTRTGPWTWHGWQGDLRAAIKKSVTETMRGREPSEEDVEALLAYLETLEAPPARELSEGGRRGEALFKAKGCRECHSGEWLTDAKVHEVGLEAPSDRYRGFNAPSLRGVGTRAPYLHDGRAATLEEVFTKHNARQRHGAAHLLGKEELADLIAYLRSL